MNGERTNSPVSLAVDLLKCCPPQPPVTRTTSRRFTQSQLSRSSGHAQESHQNRIRLASNTLQLSKNGNFFARIRRVVWVPFLGPPWGLYDC
jgi:hypothetical protein